MKEPDNISGVLSALYSASIELEPYEQRKLIKILENISILIKADTAGDQDIRSEKLTLISNYVARKTAELNPLQHTKDIVSLKILRNRAAHGDTRTLGSPAETRKYYAMVWRALSRSAGSWQPLELSNFLAYCIGTHEIDIDPYAAGADKVINLYKAAFNALDEDRKQQAFRELLMRLYSEPRLREIFETPRKIR
jgi:hypothetical protein